MSWLDKRLGEINGHRFPENAGGLLKLVTNALVDRGYKRFQVRREDGQMEWVIWAKSAQAIHDSRPESALVVKEIPLFWFFAVKQVEAGRGSMKGDVILFEEADDVDSRTADTVAAWLACPAHLRAEKFPASAA